MSTQTTYTRVIRQADMDMTQRTSLSTIIGILLDVAGEDADSKGLGINAINSENHTWVLSRLAFEIDCLPRRGESIEISTWIEDFNRLLSKRNFTLRSPQGEVKGGATSQWCMLDTLSRRAVDLTPLSEEYSQYVLGEYKSPIAPPRKIRSLEGSISTHSHCVTYSDIDFNGHLNSLRYIDLILDTLPLEMLQQQRPLRVDLQFIHECYHGEELQINHTINGDEVEAEILRGDNTTALKCAIEWR